MDGSGEHPESCKYPACHTSLESQSCATRVAYATDGTWTAAYATDSTWTAAYATDGTWTAAYAALYRRKP